MSGSELSDALDATPSDATIESTLRGIVREALKNDEEITVRIARTRAEQQLDLDADFFKDDNWKERSKNIISSAVEEPDSPVKEKPKPGRKRKSEEPAEKPKKKAKKSAVVESDDEEVVDEDEEEEEKPKAKAKPKPKPKPKPRAKAAARKSPVVESSDEEEEEDERGSKQQSPKANDDGEDEQKSTAPPKPNGEEPSTNKPSNPQETEDNDNDSDLSSLIDDPSPKKKAARGKKSTSPGASTANKATKKSTNTKTTSKPPSADEEEIKRLQSQLLKCGIRKLWHRELAPHDTSKAKIAHLKGMLVDAGMTGRFSAEKARAIKESRELAAELESARDFEEQWGTGGRGRRAKRNVGKAVKEDDGSGEEEGADEDGVEEEAAKGNKRPGGRVLPKGLVDFGDSGDDGSD